MLKFVHICQSCHENESGMIVLAAVIYGVCVVLFDIMRCKILSGTISYSE